MEAAAGEVLGPRPGKAICSFWQGQVEIVLWIVAPLVSTNCLELEVKGVSTTQENMIM